MADQSAPILPAVVSPPITPWSLFLTFAAMGLQGFGGVMPWARRILVEQRGWVDNREFTELFSLSQILPGPNICNLASILGYRWCGLRGAAAALLGLLGPSALVVLAIGVFYEHVQAHPAVAGAVRGMSSVAVGLVIATGIKMAQTQPRTWRVAALGLASLVAVGLLHWPLLWVLSVLIPLALALEWLASRKVTG
ncbi:chromate transporter [Silvimonas soli]|uniref:chromate transporter n=1 Tax=Silvimonas soli TaxID=2980100 RepID=UPI0024B35A3D|nr:chromate transporter [Silvimonas soli]